MKKCIAIFLLFSTLNTFSQTIIEPGAIDLDPEGITTPFTGVSLSPDQSTLFASSMGSRIYLFNVSTPGKIAPVWKNLDLAGFKGGARAVFSETAKYIAIRDYGTHTAKTRSIVTFGAKPKMKQVSGDAAVVDAATGKVLFQKNNVYHIAFVGADKVFVSFSEGFGWYGLPGGEEIKTVSIADNECATITPDGKTIIASIDPDNAAFKELSSVQKRKREAKNAGKFKRLLFFFDVNNIKQPKYISNEEVDIVTDMKFGKDAKYLYYVAHLNGEEHGNAMNAPAVKVIERVEVATGIIDRGFGFQSGDMAGDFTTSTDENTFAYSDAYGMVGTNREVAVHESSNLKTRTASFLLRGGLFKMSSHFSGFALCTNRPIVYIGTGKRIIEWDYKKLPKYFRTPAPASNEEIGEKCQQTLTALLDTTSKLNTQITKANISGTYIMDITIAQKGMVQTVYCESDEKTNIAMQNNLKDIIRKYQFDIDLPKDRRVKFRYVFQL